MLVLKNQRNLFELQTLSKHKKMQSSNKSSTVILLKYQQFFLHFNQSTMITNKHDSA
jgi:hypothetical protein